MATKPTENVEYAINAIYGPGLPDTGAATKVAITAQDIAEGNIRGEGYSPSSQRFNWWMNAVGRYCLFIQENVFSSEADEFGNYATYEAAVTNTDRVLIEDQSASYAKKFTTVADILSLGSGTENVTATIPTANDTPVTFAPYVTVADDTTIFLDLNIIARDLTTGDRSAWKISAVVSRNGASTLSVLNEDFAYTFNPAGWAVEVVFTAQTISLRVTGDASNSVNWECIGRAMEVS